MLALVCDVSNASFLQKAKALHPDASNAQHSDSEFRRVLHAYQVSPRCGNFLVFVAWTPAWVPHHMGTFWSLTQVDEKQLRYACM